MGVGAAYPLVKWVFGTRILSYTHYPTISSDMVDQVDLVQYNNNVAQNKRWIKKLYYRALMFLYSLGGYCSD